MDQSNRPLVPAPPMPAHAVIDDAFIKSRILTIRGVQVMLDRDLALFYGVPTKRLNEQVKRNRDRFPARFMFRLACEEVASLRSQIATSNGGAEFGTTALRSQFATLKRGGTRYLPYAFTEHGVIMLASVLNSPTAVRASVKITDAFVAMRRAIASIAPLLARIEEAERLQTASSFSMERNCITSARPSRTSAANTAPSREWTHCSFRPFSKGSKRDEFLVSPSARRPVILVANDTSCRFGCDVGRAIRGRTNETRKRSRHH